MYGGELPEIRLTIAADETRTQFWGGDTIRYEAHRSTTADLDPDLPFSWNVHFHHNQHYYPIVAGRPGMGGELTLPTGNHDGNTNVWYRFYLTMQTADGLRLTRDEALFPQLVTVTVQTAPAGGWVKVNQVRQVTPHLFTAVVNERQSLEVHPVLVKPLSGVYDFAAWEIWPQEAITPKAVINTPDQLILAPKHPITYQAKFSFRAADYPTFLPVVRR